MRFKVREFWRDLEALSSFTFYLATIVRSLVGWDWIFFGQLTAGLVLSQLVLKGIGTALNQKISSHASNGGLLLVLINVFYHSLSFLVFSMLLFVLALIGHRRLRRHSWPEIITGLAIGLASAGTMWWAARLVL